MMQTDSLLTANDLAGLEKCFINEELANQAGLFRVESLRGAELIGRSGRGNYAGMVFPNYWPGVDTPREFRLRRDQPDLEQKADGSTKEKGKYLSPPGRASLLYFVRGTPAEWLTDEKLPIVITEGEKKTIALYRLAFHNSSSPRFFPIGLAGVWNWRGVVGRTADGRGERREVKGVITDFDRIVWRGRAVYIVFDSDVATNEKVRAARYGLTKELNRRGATVRLVDLPISDSINGVDDLMAARGPDFVLGLMAAAHASDEKVERKSQATRLVELASDAELFHTPDDEPYASLEVLGHLETWPVKSRGFREWLTRGLYEAERKAPAAQGIQDALNVLSSRARFDGECCEVHIRIAQHANAIYVDLADKSWRVVKVCPDGWQVIPVADAPVRFRRTKGMLPLPVPQSNCDINDLRDFINVIDQEWPLVLGALVAYFRPNRPFPILALHGEQGSAKSTTARVLRTLIDPNKAALRSEPRDERDLMIAATNGWVVALDNLSRIPPTLSDALCRLTTGGGFGTRKLYENDEEVLFDAMRPVIVNGIEELATRSDLLDRSIVLSLPAIPDETRRTEAELWNNFELKQPEIFGALLDAVSCALRNESNVHFERLPRMADFAQWAVAAEPALGLREGAFMCAYVGNREAANELALDASPASMHIAGLIEHSGRWEGTASELLDELSSSVGDDVKKQYGWPKSAQRMGGVLKRLAPNLRAMGIRCERGSGRGRRTWTIEKSRSPLSPLSPSPPNHDGKRTLGSTIRAADS